jgi:SOS-response transcriptional repressor LexA
MSTAQATQATARQQQAADWIAAHWAEHCYAPTVREVAAGLGITVNGAAGHLAALRAKGLVVWQPKQSRSIQIVTGGAA